MKFISVQDMSAAILANRRKLPDKIDLVVGIPRSGMLPATMLATQLNLPLTDLDGLVSGKVFGYGATKDAPDVDKAMSEQRTVLVIDDTVGSGRAFKKARVALEGVSGNIVFCSVYSQVAKHPDVDVVLETNSLSPVCQWNMMHHAVLQNACVDIDGVLCCNPEAHEDDDGKAYRKFLQTAEKLHATSGEIAWLVTSRHEKYRAETEAWMRDNGVRYGKLIMTQTDEEKANSPAFKARIYVETGADLFIESEAYDAAEIQKISQRPVLCVATQSMIHDGSPIRMRSANGSKGSAALLAKVKLQARRMAGDKFYYAMKTLAGRG
ncbi:phosphoribosyltransferase [Donghicola sp.]|jgi:hypoxanthine phosphoribosyltransferase|uniref:phosphoribosyltransferase n=1 Tax=Donghicola sp. TaxID=1929294 RepID=UPI0025E83595|nr:phosphoribosyltransferase family protein [Donghicola sp.]MCT4578123.1 phosphoribosyltransferase family protein [Donghicola sp.]